MLKIIQLGLSFSDGSGNWAEGCACWQFNFKFSLTEDMFAEDSIELLKVRPAPVFLSLFLPSLPLTVERFSLHAHGRPLGSTLRGSRRTASTRTCSAS